jgi:hypothetical protein
MDVFSRIINAVMEASGWNGGGDKQDNRVTADLLQNAFNLGSLTEKEGNFLPFTDLAVSNCDCGADGVLGFMPYLDEVSKIPQKGGVSKVG